MGEGDYMPASGHRRKPIDPKRVQQIKEGWKKADAIRKQADQHQKEHDAPKADEDLLKDLDELPNGEDK